MIKIIHKHKELVDYLDGKQKGDQVKVTVKRNDQNY